LQPVPQSERVQGRGLFRVASKIHYRGTYTRAEPGMALMFIITTTTARWHTYKAYNVAARTAVSHINYRSSHRRPRPTWTGNKRSGLCSRRYPAIKSAAGVEGDGPRFTPCPQQQSSTLQRFQGITDSTAISVACYMYTVIIQLFRFLRAVVWLNRNSGDRFGRPHHTNQPQTTTTRPVLSRTELAYKLYG